MKGNHSLDNSHKKDIDKSVYAIENDYYLIRIACIIDDIELDYKNVEYHLIIALSRTDIEVYLSHGDLYNFFGVDKWKIKDGGRQPLKSNINWDKTNSLQSLKSKTIKSNTEHKTTNKPNHNHQITNTNINQPTIDIPRSSNDSSLSWWVIPAIVGVVIYFNVRRI
jgi:hypothetical protein